MRRSSQHRGKTVLMSLCTDWCLALSLSPSTRLPNSLALASRSVRGRGSTATQHRPLSGAAEFFPQSSGPSFYRLGHLEFTTPASRKACEKFTLFLRARTGSLLSPLSLELDMRFWNMPAHSTPLHDDTCSFPPSHRADNTAKAS